MREIVKVREDFELEGLEKYGFKFNENFDCWDYKGDFSGYRGLTTYFMIHIYRQERELFCSMYIGCNESHDTTREIDISVLYDLVKDGVVVKEVVE